MPDTHSPFRRKATSWFASAGVVSGSAAVALSCLVAMSAQAQGIRPEVPRQAPQPNQGQAPVPDQGQAPVPGDPAAEDPLGLANRHIDTPPRQYGAPRAAGDATAPQRTLVIEPSVEFSLIADDNVGLTSGGKRRDLILEASPRLDVTSRGARHRLSGTVGLDHTEYTQENGPSSTRPVANVALESMLVDNTFYLDAGAQVERRAASAYGAQTTGVATSDQVDTAVYRLSPRLEMHPGLAWNALLRSDNTWTRRSDAGVDAGSFGGDAYSRSTQAHFNREPEPLGFGIEGSEESLRLGDNRDEVLNLKSARATVGYRVSPQFTVHLLAGKERSKFSERVETDTDAGFRMRWAPLERSVLSVEARRRFFGNGFNAEWNHRSRMFGFTIAGSREPVTQPESLRLVGDVERQFTAIYQARGLSPAEVDASVLNALAAPYLNGHRVLIEPVTVYVTRPQLASTARASISMTGRRTMVVWSVYGRRLEQLRRSEDAIQSLLPGDIEQRGSQLLVSYRVTPMVSVDTFLRYDRAESLANAAGGSAANESTDTLLSAATSYWLSPQMRVSLGAQRHWLDSSTGGAAAGNVGTFTVLYRF